MNNNVSVLMPCFNEELYIEEAILSIVNQVEELIISDNASTDNTYNICKSLANKYKNIRLFKQNCNIGGSANNNFLFGKIQTDYVMMIGAHDRVSEGYINILLNLLLSSETNVSLVCSKVAKINAYGEILSYHYDADFPKEFMSNNPYERFYGFLKTEFPYCFYGLMRKELLTDFFDREIYAGSDYVSLAKFIIKGKFIRAENTIFYLRDAHPNDTNEEYMERVTGNKNLNLDMSIAIEKQLNQFLQIRNDEYKESVDYFYEMITKDLHKRFAIFSLPFIQKNFKMKIEHNKINSQKYILYGVSSNVETILTYMNKEDILCFVDKDIKKHNTIQFDIPVYSLDILFNFKEKIIITLSHSLDEIINELKTIYKINGKQIIYFGIQ